jgi:hypothetical protein
LPKRRREPGKRVPHPGRLKPTFQKIVCLGRPTHDSMDRDEPMGSGDTTPLGRRTFLAGVAGVGVLGATDLGSGRRQETGSSFDPLGTVGTPSLGEVVVDDDGTTAYGALDDGFAVYDVSDPSAPEVLVERDDLIEDADGGPLTGIRDVDVDGDRLLVAGPNAGPGPDGIAGFAVFDVSDPAKPSRMNATRTGHAIHNGFLADGIAYCTGTGAGGEPLLAYDAEGGAEPVGRWSVTSVEKYADVPRTFRSCHDVYVQDGTAYVAYWDAGTWLLDVSDPTSPEPTANLGGVPPSALSDAASGTFPPRARELPGNSHYVQPNADGSVVAVGKEAWDDEETDHDGGPGGVELWDVSDPTAAERLSILAPPGPGDTAHNFGWRDGKLYTSWYEGGVRVFDVSDPTAPTLLGSWSRPEKTSFWTAVPAKNCVLAASYYDPSNSETERFNGVGATLYTFPHPEGEGTAATTITPRSPRTTSPTPTTEATTRTTEATADTPTTETTTASTPDPATAASTTGPPTDGDSNTTTESESGGQPGFGVVATLLGSGSAAWRLRGRDDEN